jgi:Ca2+-binding RTX toxin-like protein
LATLVGTNRLDARVGTRGDDRIDLRGGRDVGVGRARDDLLSGGRGFDTLFGGSGNDLFGHVAGRGEDPKTGRPVRFGFGEDLVRDFTRGEDRIEIVAFRGLGSGARTLPFDRLDRGAGLGLVTVDEVARPSLVLDTEALLGLDLPGRHTLTLYDVTYLTRADVAGCGAGASRPRAAPGAPL